MIKNTLLALCLMIFCGMVFGRLVKRIKLPNVTGYLLAGLMLGPSITGIISQESLEGFNLISNVALGFIAFSIGNEFKLSYFRRMGRAPVVIAVLESLAAVIVVLIGLLLAGYSLPFSLVLSAISAATAPAATVMVIKQYRAKGPMTETLLSVVAIDDATTLIYFSLCVAVANAIEGRGLSVGQLVLEPVIEILGGLAVGAVLGFIMSIPMKFFKKQGNRLSLVVGFIFLGVALSQLVGFSSLLLLMAMGAVFCNMSPDSDTQDINRICDDFTPPLYMLFFVVSGADLKLAVLPSIGLVGVLFIGLRIVGKIAGTYAGAAMCGSSPVVRKYLGLGLLPMAGVAIGLSLVAEGSVPQYAETIRAVVLCSTLIFELIGPGVSKLGLVKAGEIVEEPRKPKRASA